MDRKAPRPTFDTPSRPIVVEPLESPENAEPIAVPADGQTQPDDDDEQPSP